MSTTRTNDKALTKKHITALKKQQKALEAKEKVLAAMLKTYKITLATIYTKSFLGCPYNNRTELMYCFIGRSTSSEPIIKVGRTTMRITLINRTGSERTWKVQYTYLSGKECDKHDPITDEEYELFKKDLALKLEKAEKNRLIVKSGKKDYVIENVDQGVNYYVSPKHDPWEHLYLASARFGSTDYNEYDTLLGWFAFPYEVVNGVLHDSSYWETEVQKVLYSFRKEHRIRTVKSLIPDLYDPRDPKETATLHTVIKQNSSDRTENAAYSQEDFWEYLRLYRETCEELGGIWIPFTSSFYRHQIHDKVNGTPDYADPFCAELTKCHWEGIKRQMEMDEHKHEHFWCETPDVSETGDYIELPSDFPFDSDSSVDSDLELED